MTFVAGYSEYGQELCRIFGENPKEVRSICLTVAPDEVITVTIEKYVQEENMDAILQTIRKAAWIQLVEKEKEEEKS